MDTKDVHDYRSVVYGPGFQSNNAIKTIANATLRLELTENKKQLLVSVLNEIIFLKRSILLSYWSFI